MSTTTTPLDGIYRVEITDADLGTLGVTKDAASQLHGPFTWTIERGMMSFDRAAANQLDQPHEDWYLAVRGDRAMLIDTTPEPQRSARNVLWAGTWSKDTDGNLRLENYLAGASAAPFDRVWWFSKPFTRLR